MKFEINSDKCLKEILIIKIIANKDNRGSFFEVWNNELLTKIGISQIVQTNQSNSKLGVIRGLHWQSTPWEQGKLILCLKGEIQDIALDLRPRSATFGEHTSIVLSERLREMVWIPPGFAHGFQSLQDDTEIIYFVTKPYNPKFENSINPLDTNLNINWLLSDKIIGSKDLTGLNFDSVRAKLKH
jgi:dTDP-4-dehydrorhamnose 3,5-epimerase